MRRAFHLLVIMTVLMCGVHLGEPAQAHELIDQLEQASADGPADDGDPDDRGTDTAAHASHHHCPIAPDQQPAAASDRVAHDDGMLFVPPVSALRSHSQAPPVEPPLA